MTWLALPVVVFFVGWPFVYLRLGGGFSLLGAVLMLGPSLGVLVAFFVAVSIARRRDARVIWRAGKRVCAGCRYVLEELPEKGNCPECGTRYAQADLDAFWSHEYSDYWDSRA